MEAEGSIAAEDITINGIDPALSSEPFLILRAGTTIAPGEITLAQGNTQRSAGTNFNSRTGVSSLGSLEVGNIVIDASGVGGPVILEAAGDIKAASITSNGGEIFLNSNKGEINTSSGILNSTAARGDSGRISLQAEGNITTGGLNASGFNINGDDITLLSGSGLIDTSAGTVDASSVQGNSGEVFFHAAEGSITGGDLKAASPNGASGNITLFAGDNVNTANIDALGLTGGEVSLSSTNGAIDTRGESPDAAATSVKGSAVSLHALENVTIANVEANGGQIGLTSTEGAINTISGTLDSATNGGAGGAVTLQALTDVTTGQIISHGGTISLNSGLGDIHTTAGTLDSSSDTGEGGEITLAANRGDITTREITSDGGQISLTSLGDIHTTAGTLDSSSDTGEGGEITLESNESITIGEITSDGGQIALEANGDITTGDITSDGGQISLTSLGDIHTTAGTLDSSSDTGAFRCMFLRFPNCQR